jgi:PHP family Zn ribbon phosphoesterase
MVGTIEFFPQEGKYHHDGHRACNIQFIPEQTKQHKGICPVCHRPLTVGVDYRVSELANHPENYKPQNGKKVEYIIPLVEILAELKGVGSSSKKVTDEFERIYTALGNEFHLLREMPITHIEKAGFPQLAYAIERMRKGDVSITPGYDGVYGVIKLFENNNQRQELNDQMSLGF